MTCSPQARRHHRRAAWHPDQRFLLSDLRSRDRADPAARSRRSHPARICAWPTKREAPEYPVRRSELQGPGRVRTYPSQPKEVFWMAKRRRTPPRAHTTPRRSGVKKSKPARRTAPPRETRRIRPAAPPSGLAPGMPAVNAYLAVANVGATIDFLQRAFGFSRGVTLADTDGQLRYAEMRHGDSVVMLVRQA